MQVVAVHPNLRPFSHLCINALIRPLGMCQEIHPYWAISLCSVKINTSLVLMRELHQLRWSYECEICNGLNASKIQLPIVSWYDIQRQSYGANKVCHIEIQKALNLERKPCKVEKQWYCFCAFSCGIIWPFLALLLASSRSCLASYPPPPPSPECPLSLLSCGGLLLPPAATSQWLTLTLNFTCIVYIVHIHIYTHMVVPWTMAWYRPEESHVAQKNCYELSKGLLSQARTL